MKTALERFLEQERLIDLEVAQIRAEISKLQLAIDRLNKKDIYAIVYRQEDGDYKQFVENLAKELRLNKL